MTRITRAIQHFRHYSSVAAIIDKSSSATKKLVYTSPNAGLVKIVKKFSLTTLGISAFSTPAVMYFWESPAVQAADMTGAMFIGESLTRYVLIQMLMTAMMASACSTGALSFLLSPYVNTIHVHTSNNNTDKVPPISPNTTISIDTLDLLARRRTTTLQLKDLLPIQSTFLTWTVNKQTLKKQYQLEQLKGIEPRIKQTRFWLDQRNGYGDRDVMSSILRVIYEQGRQRFI